MKSFKIPFTWENRHPVFLEKCLYIPGFYDAHDAWEKVGFDHPSFFGNTNPVAIEYCSGNGEWIFNMAKKEPQMNWIAVEKRFDRARKIWSGIKRENIPNLFVVCGEGLAFSRYYAPKTSVSKIYVNFPDPWPKLRHAKHRLIKEDFLSEIEKILIPNAHVFFTTDDKPYADQMLETAQRPRWEKENFTTDIPNFGTSYFSDLWKKQGRTIYHLDFKVMP